VTLAGLGVDVIGLTVGVNLAGAPLDPSTYTLDLAGLDVSFQGGPVDLNGGLLKTTDAQGNLEYAGTVSLRAAEFALTAHRAHREGRLRAARDHPAVVVRFRLVPGPDGWAAVLLRHRDRGRLRLQPRPDPARAGRRLDLPARSRRPRPDDLPERRSRQGARA